MPYTRQRPDGMNETNQPQIHNARSHRKFPRITAATKTTKGVLKSAAITSTFALFQHAAHAKPKLTGVWGWTSGSQTYLRARPGAQTPPVAKVPTHTKLYVWGTFNGWYRVETTDHIFGWVNCEYLNAPGAEKLQELSHDKAKQASDRTGHQTMYGSKELLSRYYARYGASGAAKGLAKQGVRVAERPSTERSKAVAPKIAKSSPRNTTTRPATPRLATTPQVRTISTGSTTRSAPTRVALREPAPRAARRPALPAIHDPSFNDVGNVRLNSTHSSGNKPVARKTAVKAESKTNAKAAPSGPTQAQLAATNTRAANARKDVEAKRAQQFAQQAAARKLAQAQAAQAQALAAQKLEAQRLAARQSAMRQATARQAATQAAAKQANARRESQQRLAAQQAAWHKRRQARLWAARQAQLRREARAAARARIAAAKRDDLRRSLNGTVAMSPPPTTAPGLRPLSPEELMRARDQYLSQKGNAGDPTISQAPGDTLFTPSSFRPTTIVQPSFSPALFNSSSSGFIQTTFRPSVPMTATPSTYNDEWVSPLPGAPLFVTKPKAAPAPRVARNAVKAPAPKVSLPKVAVRKAPALKAPIAKAPSRGGSMRDYALYASRQQNQNNFGDGMATQALSYRGMPYIRGASSPRSGFDCSGLIFYLLRQRGLNPPRTSGAMASYGQRVGKGDLQRGDIVLFANTYKRGVSHVGIYMGNGNFVHAANARAGVRVDSMTSGYYANKYWGARRAK